MWGRVHTLEGNLSRFSETGQEFHPPPPRILVLNWCFPPIEHDIQLPRIPLYQVLPESRQHLVDLSPILIRGEIEIDVGVLSEESDCFEMWRVDRGQDGDDFCVRFIGVHAVEFDFAEFLAIIEGVLFWKSFPVESLKNGGTLFSIPEAHDIGHNPRAKGNAHLW